MTRLRNLKGMLITHKSGFGYFYGSSVRQFMFCGSECLQKGEKLFQTGRNRRTEEQKNRRTDEFCTG